jgi:hypothetical protein
MKNLNDQFSDEEKQHLNYLGSMLGRPNTPEEQEMEDMYHASGDITVRDRALEEGPE